ARSATMKMNMPFDSLGTLATHVATAAAALFSIASAVQAAGEANWQPAKGPLMTRWAADVSPDKLSTEYPTPQLQRPDWQSLNGLWDYAIRPKAEPIPARFDGQIMVPFPVESALSGVMKTVGQANRLWYRRNFEWPERWQDKRAILHFGAVDW